jgi:hypothetical protein
MDRRDFLTGTSAAFLANIALLRPVPGGSTVLRFFQAEPTGVGELLVGQPVNLFRYGRIQSWLNPELSSALQVRFAGPPSGGTQPVGRLDLEGPQFDLGVEWPESRTIDSIVVRFAGPTPQPLRQSLEIWEGLTVLQGNWKALPHNPDDQLDGQTWTVRFPAIRTFKVRLRILDKDVAVDALEVHGPSLWKVGEVRIEWGHEAEEKVRDGHLEIYNGEILHVTPLPRTVLQPGGSKEGRSWTGTSGNGVTSGIMVKVLYTSGMDVDRTILTLRTRAGDFSFLPREALEEQAIYIPDFGVFIRNSDSDLSLDEYRRRHQGQVRIADAVAKLPEQTLEQAYQHIDADRVVAFVGVDSNSQKFGITPGGQVIVGYDDPSFGRTIEPKFTVHFDHVELSTVFEPSEPPPPSLFQKPTDKKQHLAEGWLPILITEWGSASDVSYERTDFASLPGQVTPIDQSKLTGDELAVLISRLRLRNNSPTAKTVHFYIKPWKLGADPFPYKAIFAGAKDIWQTSLAGHHLMVAEGDSQFGICSVDTGGKGALELAPAIQGARYAVELNGGEEHEIHMVIPGRPVAQSEIAGLTGLPYDRLYAATAQYWKAMVAQGMQLELPDEHLQNLYNANLQHFLLTFTKDPRRDEYYPNISTFHYGPNGSESSPIVQALDMRGMHGHAEKCLQAFLSTQGDALPDGEYRSPEGGFCHYWSWYTIGHGFVLWALAEHYFYSGDKGWLQRVAPQIVAGCDFVAKGRKVTERELPGGGRPISYGFAPAGTVGDPRSWEYTFMISGFFYLGLKKCAQALQDVDPENAKRFEAEAADFLSAIRAGLKESTALSPVGRLRDGTSVPITPSFVTSRGFTSDAKDNVDPDPRFSYAFDCLAGAFQLLKCEVLTLNDPETDWLLNTLEDRFFMFSPHQHARVRLENISQDWFNLGGFDKMQPYYLGYPDAYLQRDQIPNFLRAFFNTLAVIADKQNLSFQEEIGGVGGQPQKTHEEARFLQQLRIMLLMESGPDLYLARGTPRSWLEHGKHIAVDRAPSYFGDLSFRIQSFVDQGHIEATVQPPSRNRPVHIYLRFRHPKEAQPKRVSVNGKSWKDFSPEKEWISLPVDAGQLNVTAYY